MNLRIILLSLFSFLILLSVSSNNHPKREFRGAWLQTVNGHYKGMSAERMQRELLKELDGFKEAGINAVIFQVRPEADAFYVSTIEPWSRFFTGTQGTAPSPLWDPMTFVIEESHKRGMEFHAWVNPYRVRTNNNVTLASGHIYWQNPGLFIEYGNQTYFDPGRPESRKHIYSVVKDIVERYDVDAIHMDDYFYPYPIKGTDFPDDLSFARYGMGFANKNDWRRDNVNVLIKELHETIRATKSWVKFGISPFGIYRNMKNDPQGSMTNGLQNYDDLYADILLWIREGWIDYNMPQIYWEIGHPVADYETLINWWAEYASGRPLFIGQDIMRTVKKPDLKDPSTSQLARKMELQRSFSSISGSCMWPGRDLIDNPGNMKTALTYDYHRYPALIPVFSFIDNIPPGEVSKIKDVWTEDGLILFWQPPKAKTAMDVAVQYVVYRFEKKEKENLDDPSKIVAITRNSYYKLPYTNGKTKYKYVVTALDRLHNESKGKKKNVKL